MYNKAARSFCVRGTVAKSSDAEDAFSNIVPVELLFNVSKQIPIDCVITDRSSLFFSSQIIQRASLFSIKYLSSSTLYAGLRGKNTKPAWAQAAYILSISGDFST